MCECKSVRKSMCVYERRCASVSTWLCVCLCICVVFLKLGIHFQQVLSSKFLYLLLKCNSLTDNQAVMHFCQSGRIKWCRCLMYNMTETVESVCAHPVLRALPASTDLMRKYTNSRTLIPNYEETMGAMWMNQNESRI